MHDAYERFFARGDITKQQFFEFGLSETIYAPQDKAEQGWEALKEKIRNNEVVFIRGYGKNSSKTHLFFDLYKTLSKHVGIKQDPGNNVWPTKVITNQTGYSKYKKNGFEHIQNYQVSHIFGRTKNIYTFTAPWNIAYIPKILDPFTGHEAKGDYAREYRNLFQQQSYDRFRHMIEEFNAFMQCTKLLQQKQYFFESLQQSSQIDQRQLAQFKKDVCDKFRPILPPDF